MNRRQFLATSSAATALSTTAFPAHLFAQSTPSSHVVLSPSVLSMVHDNSVSTALTMYRNMQDQSDIYAHIRVMQMARDYLDGQGLNQAFIAALPKIQSFPTTAQIMATYQQALPDFQRFDPSFTATDMSNLIGPSLHTVDPVTIRTKLAGGFTPMLNDYIAALETAAPDQPLNTPGPTRIMPARFLRCCWYGCGILGSWLSDAWSDGFTWLNHSIQSCGVDIDRHWSRNNHWLCTILFVGLGGFYDAA